MRNCSLANADIRKAARVADVPQWKIAHALGVTEVTFVRWLRLELPEEKRKRILAAIESLSQEVV